MTALIEPAPAKLNLALHVRGRLADGRHRLETLFAFCEGGDVIGARQADELTLVTGGPFASQLASAEDNLVMRAAQALRAATPVEQGAALTLDKQLPVASGIGGGSADAAATLRLLTRLWRIAPGHAATVAPTLGSDVPACLIGRTCRGTEAGDSVELIDDPWLEARPVLLVNPGLRLETGAVFERWDGIDRGPLGDWRQGRNDLAGCARQLVPQIGDVLTWLELQPGAAFVRMSGSGATCFALFDSIAARDAAAAQCAAHRPDWWHLATSLR